MSVRHSPSKSGTSSSTKGGSLTDLSKITLDNTHVTQRKRKQPEQDCDCKHELHEFRQEFGKMTELLEKIIQNQEQGMDSMRKNLDDIKEQISEIKSSTTNLTMEQNNIKLELISFKNRICSGENKIQTLESNVTNIANKIAATDTKFSTLEANFSSANVIPTDVDSTKENLLREMQDRHNRLKNIIVSGIPEIVETNISNRRDNDQREVTEVLNTLSNNCPQPVKIFRIGKYNPDKHRNIKVCFNEAETPRLLLSNRSKLGKPLKIFSDQTPMQQQYFNKVKNEFTQRQLAGETNLIIKYVKGVPKIVIQSVPKN